MSYTASLKITDGCVELRVGESPVTFRVDSSSPVNVVSLLRLSSWVAADPLLGRGVIPSAGCFKWYGDRMLFYLGTYNVRLRFDDLIIASGCAPRCSDVTANFDVVQDLVEPALGRSFLASIRGVQYYELSLLSATLKIPEQGKSICTCVKKCENLLACVFFSSDFPRLVSPGRACHAWQ